MAEEVRKPSRLENWAFLLLSTNPYQAPESIEPKLGGMVYGDPRFPDGTEVVTSPLKHINLKEGTAITENTTYVLGKVDPEFMKWVERNDYHLEDYEKAVNSRKTQGEVVH